MDEAAHPQGNDDLAAFEETGDPSRLRAALAGIEGLAAEGTDPSPVLARWLQALHSIDRVLDPEWDPADVPPGSVIPPPSGGVALPSGVAPSAVDDPDARTEYERLRGEAAEAGERYAFQLAVHRADERALAGLAETVGERPGPSVVQRLRNFLADEASPRLRTRVQGVLGKRLSGTEEAS